MIDMDRYMASIVYSKNIMTILANELPPPSNYPNTDEGVLRWLLEEFDIEALYNDPLALNIQLTLNRWIVDGEPANSIRQQIVNIMRDHFGSQF